jgi:hypothetical protein
MWEKVVSVIRMGTDIVPMDIVFWAGIGVFAFVWFSGVVRVILKGKVLPMCRYRMPVPIIVTWVYFVFALFVVTTSSGYTKFMVDMAFPIVVLLLCYLLTAIFYLPVRCKIKCTEWQNFDAKEGASPVIQSKQNDIVIVNDEEKSVQEGKEDIVKIITTDKKGKEVEINLPDVIPMGDADAALKTQIHAADADKIERISSLAEEIERRRQKNIKITDGEKENKFTSRVGDAIVTDPTDPKVVVRKITEQVELKPKFEETPKTGFTYQTVIERRNIETKQQSADASMTNRIDLQRTSNNAFSKISMNDTAETKKSAQDVLDAIAKLRNSMDKK